MNIPRLEPGSLSGDARVIARARMDGALVKASAKKSHSDVEVVRPVPETDTGGQVENTKGREITLSKELGKMTP